MGAPTTEARQQRSGFYYGWVMVGVGSTVNVFASVNGAISTVFFLPLTRDLGLSHAGLAFALSLARLESGFIGPIIGWVLDKKGPRITVTVGAFLGGVGLMLLPSVHDFWSFLLIYMGVISLGFNMGFIISMHQVANLWFSTYRTRVLSFFSAALRIGTAVFTPLLAFLVLRYGWQTTAVLAGLSILVVVLPLSFLIKRSPEAIGQHPDGAREAPGTSARGAHGGHAGAPGDGFTFGQALRTPSYWLLIFNSTVRISLPGAVRGQIIAIFVASGMSEQTGAWAAGIWALIAIPMILVLGYLGDRWSKKAILIGGQICVTLAMVTLMLAGTNVWLLGLFVVLVAFGESVAPINHSIVGDYYGRKSFGRLNGMLTTFTTIGILAPPFLGWTYDRYLDYTLGLAVFSVFAGIAFVSLLFLRRPRLPAPALTHTDAPAGTTA